MPEKNPRKRGPKLKSKNNVKSVLLQVKVTEQTNKEIEHIVRERQKARSNNYRKTDFLREAIISQFPSEKFRVSSNQELIEKLIEKFNDFTKEQKENHKEQEEMKKRIHELEKKEK